MVLCFDRNVGISLRDIMLMFVGLFTIVEVEAFIRKAIFEKYPEHKYV